MTNPIAQTILAQLGGNRFLAMTGAKNLVAGDALLQFDVRGARKISKVQVKLAGDDSYTMAFYHWNARKLALVPVAIRNGVSCDALRSIFTAETGLHTSL